MEIIFLSNQLYDFPLKTNKWQVSTRVAERGHQVLFVDPPIRFRKFVKQIFQGRWSLRRILTFIYHPQGNLTVYTPVGVLPKLGPFGRNFGNGLLNLNRRLHLWRIKRLLAASSSPVLWVYHVEMDGLEDYIATIPHDLLIYDCVDNYPAFPRYRDKPKLKDWIVRREEWLARKADLIFTTAPGLQEKLSRFNKNTFYIGNAGDYVRFAQVQSSRQKGGQAPFKVQNPLSGIPKPIIGFTGAIDSYKVNLPLLVKIAEAYPNYSLVLIGPRGVAGAEPNLSALESFSNVYLLGPKPYEAMPQYFSHFDVYIIPYNLNEYTLGGCFPVKFFDALAAGLPTVVTNLPCYQDFTNICYVAKNDDDFVRLVRIAVEENSPEKISARQKIAKEHSWDKKVKKMLEIVDSFNSGRGQISRPL